MNKEQQQYLLSLTGKEFLRKVGKRWKQGKITDSQLSYLTNWYKENKPTIDNSKELLAQIEDLSTKSLDK